MISFFTSARSFIEGFTSGYRAYFLYNQSEMLQRGASPNTWQLRMSQVTNSTIAGMEIVKWLDALKWTRMHWLITPFMFFLPFIINGWPREGADNSRFLNTKEFFRRMSFSLFRSSWILKGLGLFPYAIYGFLSIIPTIRNPYILKALFLLDKYLFELSLFFTISAYVFLFFLGHTVMAIAACATLGLGFLDNKNMLPLFVRNLFREWGNPICFLYMLLAGELVERFICVCTIPFYASIILKKPLAWILSKLGKTEMAEALREQECEMPSFDFKCDASQFIENIQAMEKAPCEVTRAHAMDNIDLLPAALPEVDLEDLSTLFESVTWSNHDKSINERWATDWQIQTEEMKEVTFDEKLSLLKGKLKEFTDKVKDGKIRCLIPGTEGLLKRYMQNITFILKKLPQTQEKLREDILLELAFMGSYCDPGILGAAQKCYLQLLNKKEELTLKECVRLIHQMGRDKYFHDQYYQKELHRSFDEMFYGRILGIKLDFLNQRNELHAYASAVCYFAPRLGLPADFSEYDEGLALVPPFLKDLTSAWMGIEHQFWKETTVEKLKNQIHEQVNYASLPIALVDKWYHQFIDAHVNGTEEEKDKIKEGYAPYEVEDHGGVPIYRLKPEILHLMLLDFGVITLSTYTKVASTSLTWLYTGNTQTEAASNEPQHSENRNQNRNRGIR